MMGDKTSADRREFLKTAGLTGAGLMAGLYALNDIRHAGAATDARDLVSAPDRSGELRDFVKMLERRGELQEVQVPRKGSKQPYKPRKEYRYTTKDIAGLAGITRNALNVAKAHGKIDPGDFKSVVSFLTRRIIDNRLKGDLFLPGGRGAKSVKGSGKGNRVSRRRPQPAGGRQ